MSQMLEAALDYAGRGWPIFPCRADKTPYTPSGVLDATTDEARIREWWERWPGANIGLNAGDAGFLVLDYDPGWDFGEVTAGLGGEMPPATKLVARTPRGGEHHYYRLRPDDPPVASSASTFAPHVDVRSFHGYVLLPPSRTADGAYEWKSEGEAHDRSQAVLDACRRARERDAGADEWIIEADLPENVELAERWLRDEARPAIQGSGGENTTYATAAMMKSYGLSPERALEAMWEHWNRNCEPHWEWDDLGVKVANAYRYNTSPPGNVTPAYRVAQQQAMFQPQVETTDDGARQVTAGRFRIIERGEVRKLKPPAWLIDDLLPEGGFGLLVGRRGSFKTFVALDLALTVATGVSTCWKPPEEPGPVLYVLGEGRSGAGLRMEGWERKNCPGSEASDILLADPVPRVSDGADPLDAFIEAALRLRPDGYALVVVDTVGRSMQGVNENAQEHASAFTALVERLQRGLGAAVLAVHHTGHGDQNRGRGSSVFEADADTVVVTHRSDETTPYVSLEMTKQKDAESWSKPRWLKAEKTHLDGGAKTTLVFVVPSREEVEAGDPKTRKEKKDQSAKDVKMLVTDRVACEILEANPEGQWSTDALAKQIYLHKDVDWSKRSTTNYLNYMKKERAGESWACRAYFDGLNDRWVCRGVFDSEVD